MRVGYQGQEVYLYTGGEPHKPGLDTILFIHGAAMDHTVWTLFSRYWAKAGYNVAAIDLSGHGLSGGQVLSGIEQNAEFICGLMEQLELTHSIYVVGHSMGSLIALECAVRFQNIRRLVMLGTAVPMGVGDALLDAARDNDHSSIDMISLFGHSFGSQLGNNPIAGISAQFTAERLLESAADGVLYTDLKACREYETGLHTAEKIQCPVGLILGELDQMTPNRGVNGLLQSLKTVREIRIPDCGHMMMSEKPEATHKALHECLKGPL